MLLLLLSSVTSAAKEMHNGIKLIIIRSFSTSICWEHKIKSCTVVISLAAHPNVKQEIWKAGSRSVSHSKTLSLSSPYSRKPHVDVKCTYRRFCRSTVASTACEVTPLDTCSKKTTKWVEKPFLRQRAQFKHDQHSKAVRFPDFLVYTDLLLEASFKRSYADLLHYGKRVEQHEKKSVYSFVLSLHSRLQNRTRLPRTSLCILQKSHTIK